MPPPSIAEYLITVLGAIKDINNQEGLLPYHKLCVMSAVVPLAKANLSVLTTAIFEGIIMKDKITFVIDSFWSKVSSFVHSLVLPYAIPILSFSSPVIFHTLGEEELIPLLVGTEAAQPNLLIQEISEASMDYLFTMAPDAADVIGMLDDMAYRFGWKRAGLVLETQLDTEDVLNSHQIETKHTKYVALAGSQPKFCERDLIDIKMSECCPSPPPPPPPPPP